MKSSVKCLMLIVSLIVVSCNSKKDEGYALTVNGHKISNVEIDRTVDFIRQSMLQIAPEKAIEPISPEMRKNAARQLIANDLMIDAANKQGMKIDSSVVSNVFKNFKAQFGDQETFKTEIAKMGETEDGIRKQMYDGALIDTLLKSKFETIEEVDSSAIKDYYENNKDKYMTEPRIRVSQIFFPFDSTTTSDSEKVNLIQKAQSVLTDIRAGKDFSKLAAQHSKGPGAASGGDMGWFESNDLRPDLAIPLSNLNKNEISDIVSSEIGLHILKKTEIDEATTAEFEKVKDHVNMVLTMEKQNDFINSYIDSLIDKAKVIYHDSSLVPSARNTESTM